MLALSTAWFKQSEGSLDDLFALLIEQGFHAFELNHEVHPLDLDEFNQIIAHHRFEITSLHNVCSPLADPLGPDSRYGDNIAALDEAARRQGVTHLRSTAETALQLGAKAVVIHAGTVLEAQNDPDYSSLRRAYAAGEIERDIVSREMQARYSRRRELGRPYLKQLLRSLREVCPEFPSLRFGLESRYHYYSLPDIDEMDYVLDALDMNNVGYWHDCGHAQVQENLGLCRHEEWLRRNRGRLVGIHLHGMGDPVHDHYAPAPGNMPYEMIGRYLSDDTVRVLELASFNDLADIVVGRDYLEEMFARVETPSET